VHQYDVEDRFSTGIDDGNDIQYLCRYPAGGMSAGSKKRGAQMVYIIMICMVVPLLLLMTMLDKSSRLLLGFVLGGMILAVCAYEMNTLVCAVFSMSGQELSITAAPVIEEILKALPVLFFAILVSDDRRLVLQLSMASGIGFAILENAFLLITYVDQVDIWWAIIRGISTSLSHGICTMIVGCGIVFVRKQKKLFYTGTFALLSAAMTLHATFNLLIQSAYDYVALALPIVIYLIYWIVKMQKEKNVSAYKS